MELVVVGLSEEDVPLLVWDRRWFHGFDLLAGKRISRPGILSGIAGIVSLADHGLSPFLQAGVSDSRGQGCQEEMLSRRHSCSRAMREGMVPVSAQLLGQRFNAR